MKNLIRICLVLILVFLLSFTLQAQEGYAKLEKNRNIQAKGLLHYLNKTKDTLILKSDKKINYLYSINKEYGRELDFLVDTTYYRLPLNKLSKGKHVFVAIQSPMRIVFVVRILKDIPKETPEEVIAEDIVAVEPVRVVHANNE
ncbi:hypothetical protein H8K90_00305 [Winogradskyella echinorum]|uniref:Uncharacterized protein n=1 Tax=Winogradskyella echinorum TaxID=538189 RepID=A0ABR6XWD9_9FLAO|nr:hypothetical protein [Winogradskyella echinorum]MBC3844806.1 hypothetical protein [Winogradskyella echinorum]MBC5749154.1 hypothetical protein [Winogradskyella echinorum]